jgi:hypothetical protein
MYEGAQGRGGRTFTVLGDCRWFAVLVGIGQIAGGFLAGLLERYLTDTAKGDVLVPCPGDPNSSYAPLGSTRMNSLWPQLCLPRAVLFYWPPLDGCSGPG